MTTPAGLRSRALRPLAVALGLAMSSAMPMLLAGALAVQITEDLGFGSRELGVVLGSFLVVSGLMSGQAGKLADRFGWHRMALLATAVTAVSMLGTAVLATSYWWLVLWIAIGGLGQAIGQTTGNLVLARESPDGRRGVFFGVKQSAIPLGGILAGLAVPTLALTVGWRWAFAAAVAIPLGVAVSVLSRPPGVNARPRPRGASVPRVVSRPLVLMAAGISLGACAVGSLGFLALAGVDAGLTPGSAGLLVSGASGTGLVARVGYGWAVDRRRSDGLPLVPLLLVVGGLGFGLLAAGVPPLLVAGAVLAHSAGWGWPGVLLHGIVWHHRRAPGAATGIIGMGTAGGAALGPMLFGAITDLAGFGAAWLLSAVLALASAGVVTRAAAALRAGAGPAVAWTPAPADDD